MKFTIKRASDGRGSPKKKPCEQATREEVLARYTSGTRFPYWKVKEVTVYTIEMNGPEDFLELIKEVHCGIIVDDDENYAGPAGVKLKPNADGGIIIYDRDIEQCEQRMGWR